MARYYDYLNSLNLEAKNRMIPFRGEFEFTSRCNLQCKFCYVANSQNQKSNELTTQQWCELIKQAVDEGMVRATFTGGEIFTRKDFEEIYKYAYDLGTRITVLTNGILINERIIDILKKRPPEIVSITLYGGSNETYNKLCNEKQGFDKVLNAIKILVDNKIPLSLKTVAHPDIPRSEFYELRELANKYGLHLTLVKYLSPIRGCKENMKLNWRLPAKEIVEITKIVEKGDEFINMLGCTSHNFLDCDCSKGRFAISHEGHMYGCLSYTELFTEPLKNGFKNALHELRLKCDEKRKNNSLCNKCAYNEKCSKCSGLNYSESGSMEICSEYRKSLAKEGIL